MILRLGWQPGPGCDSSSVVQVAHAASTCRALHRGTIGPLFRHHTGAGGRTGRTVRTASSSRLAARRARRSRRPPRRGHHHDHRRMPVMSVMDFALPSSVSGSVVLNVVHDGHGRSSSLSRNARQPDVLADRQPGRPSSSSTRRALHDVDEAVPRPLKMFTAFRRLDTARVGRVRQRELAGGG
jgi:hypothetical protein